MGEYRTILADPPWPYNRKWANHATDRFKNRGGTLDLPYSTMPLDEIAALPVSDLAHPDGAHLYLWTTNRFLHDAFHVAEMWGFKYSQLLVWAKTPRGKGPGGAFAQNAEYLLFCRRELPITNVRQESVWFNWKRTSAHSKKPEQAQDLIEQVSPGPYLELFARRERLGWDTWGNESANSSGLQLAA
jgi:N6-adenosine-specific RNA methylase IME4